jgi:ketosteroid isomerase-like protein
MVKTLFPFPIAHFPFPVYCGIPVHKECSMIKRSALVVLLILPTLCSIATAAAAQQTPSASTTQEEVDQEALRKLKAIYEQAIRENLVDALAPHLHADFHGVMVTGQAVNSFADLQQYWRNIKRLMGEEGTYTTVLNPERSIIIGDVAVARGTTDDVVKTDDGTEFRFNTLWSAVLQREGNVWKIRFMHGTMDPIGNPFVREFGRRAVVRITAITLAVGLAVGVGVGMIWQRRRMRTR